MIPKLIDLAIYVWWCKNWPLCFIAAVLFGLAYLLNNHGKGGRHAA